MAFLAYGKASVVIDGQFGSTGKGLAAATIYERDKDHIDLSRVICTTNAAPNAGHTTVMPDGRRFVTFHLPTFGVLSPESRIYLNAGAIIDPDVLLKEVRDLGVDPARIFIHSNAAVIEDADKTYEHESESSQTKIASTQKGVGRALARKVAREGKVAKDHYKWFTYHGFTVQNIDLNEAMLEGKAVMIETPQGMSLSLNSGFYPYCTSREVSVAQSLSDAGIHPEALHNTMATIRTFPIRVGHIKNEQGETVGWSGPVYPDQHELSWADDFPKVIPERTTVTKRVRRIFTFSNLQYREMLLRFRPTHVHVGFCDYLPNIDSFNDFVGRLYKVENSVRVHPSQHQYAFGPSVADVGSHSFAYDWFSKLENSAHEGVDQ